MKLTTNTRYGLRALIYIAERNEERPVSRKDISDNIDVSDKYLQVILKKLKDAEILNTSKGPGGGYSVCKSLDKITVADVVHALENSTDLVHCLGKPENCNKVSSCKTRPIWKGLTDVIDDYLGNMTLQDIINKEARP